MDTPLSPASASALWWRFQVPNSTAIHSVRVKRIGEPTQEVLIDGAPLEAPEGTMAFTGPGGSYLELRPDEAGRWFLLVDGNAVADASTAANEAALAYAGGADDVAVAWWKFRLPQSQSMHQVRVKLPGQPGQEVFIDGSPIEAPPGTIAFTGPLGSLLQLQTIDGQWCLTVDGTIANRFNPNVWSEPPLVWRFGPHEVRVVSAGKQEQELYIDGQLLSAPPGTLTFTGPGGTLLEMSCASGRWTLALDGTVLEQDAAVAGGAAVWQVLAPQDGLLHTIQVSNLGYENQEIQIDGSAVQAPPGTMTFTGPGATLMELRGSSSACLDLFVDGVPVNDHNAKYGLPPQQGQGSHADGREVVSSDQPLPQGVSYDPATGHYTANIRQHGKFMCLGHFATPDEAHQKYLQAKQ